MPRLQLAHPLARIPKEKMFFIGKAIFLLVGSGFWFDFCIRLSTVESHPSQFLPAVVADWRAQF